MCQLFLIVCGLLLAVTSPYALLGVVAFLVGLFCSRRNEPMWCIVLGVLLLLFVPGWNLAGIIGIVMGLFATRK